MSVSRFKFVSPGISLKEIDKSKTPTESTAVGPVVIGRSVRGPGMRPVKVQSYADFVELFGEPDPGNSNEDIWRNGTNLAPTYGAYAAKAYLANNGPLTFVRLLGVQNEEVQSTVGYAGWATENKINTAITGNGGAFGLFIVPISGSGDVWTAANNGNPVTGVLAATFYVNQGIVGLVGKPLSGSSDAIFGSASVLVRTDDASTKEFRIAISRDNTSAITSSFNLVPTDKKFIRNVFNTNPSLMNSRVTPSTSLKNYFLGQSYEQSIDDSLTSITSGSYAAVILALQSGSENAGNYNKSAAASSTGWIVGQYKGVNTGFVASSGEYPVQKLFKFYSLTEGEWNQNNIKISISDIKPSPSNYEKYGSFTVTVRKMNDDDQNLQPLEVYTGLNLNPSSPNYIAKRIGDSYSVWSPTKKMYEEYGTNLNISKYIRVEMDPVCASINQDLLPFGFYGPQRFKTVPNILSTLATASLGSGVYSGSISSGYFASSKVANSPTPAQTDDKIISIGSFNMTLTFPELPTINTASAKSSVVSDSVANTIENTYWGLKTKQKNSRIFNPEVRDVVRTLPLNASSVEDSFLFTLDEIVFFGSTNANDYTVGSTGSVAYWSEGSRAGGTAYLAKTGSYVGDTAFQRIARFTLPLVGGFDGFDITEKEPFAEGGTGAPLMSTDDELTSYAYNSINRAIDTIADSEVVEMNLLAVPGVQNVKLTNKLIETCEARADALAIIDLDGDFKSAEESYASPAAEKRPVSAEQIAANMKSRGINSSYGCAFFPAVLAKDTSANVSLGMPSSVIALGVMGSSAAATDVWFAPAGFTRGGLTNGAAGLPVLAVKSKLSSKDRDMLYETNVNPIASFPAEGIVVFGQKTLQVTPSSLDRINVRRLMIYLKKEISRFASTLLFDPNNEVTWARFTGKVVPFLQDVKTRFGLTDFKVVLDSTTTTPELVDRNILYAKIFLKPARAIEFIALDFILTNTGASFDD